MKGLIIAFVLVSVSSCNANDEKAVDTKNLISKKYFVKGMTCGGCIVGVKAALNKSANLKISDKDIDVGEVEEVPHRLRVDLLDAHLVRYVFQPHTIEHFLTID